MKLLAINEKRNEIYRILSGHRYSASCGVTRSEALPECQTSRKETGFEESKQGGDISSKN